ncbi:MAG: hypothetical protein HRT93_00120 [Piscirickettsiaceae bacterium]|nr:hypothetical protein [Piscirickettsiaceae bacterium]
MHSTLLKTATAAFLSCIVLMSTQVIALDLNLNLEDKSALTRLTDTDWTLLKSTAKNALDNSDDGSSHVWKNPETSNAGVITILSTDESNGIFCRKARFINTAGELTSTTFVDLCKQEGIWTEVSLRSTTTSSQLPANDSSSEMFDDASVRSTDITNKTLGQTSEYCLELFRNIEDLKGKPARRSVAIDLHKAECLR